MANPWLVSNQVRSLKLRGLIPTSSKLFGTDDFLFLLHEAVRLEVMALILAVNESDYLTQHLDITLQAGVRRYRIPDRAAAEQISLVQAGTAAGGFVPVDDISRRNNTGFDSGTQRLSLFYQLDDDAIILTGTPSDSGVSVLRINYRARPGRLVDASAVAEITAINPATNTVTVASYPTSTVVGSGSTPSKVAFTTALLYDFVHGTPGFRCVDVNRAISALDPTGKTITFTTALPTDLVVGDFVTLAGESPIVQMPEAVHPLVSQWGVLVCERAIGDVTRIATAQSAVAKAEDSLKSLLSKQKGDTSSPVINPYARGYGRSSWRGGRWLR